MQTITLREIVDANRRALAEEKLIAMWDETHEPFVDYWNPDTGRGCAIGVAMTPETIKLVMDRQRSEDGCTYLSVASIVDQNLAAFSGHPQATLIASITQHLHDAWYDESHMRFSSIWPNDQNLLKDAFGCDEIFADQKNFTTWLDHVEKTYITEPA